ncbi:MAG: response regulator [Anaerolineales bacterium]|nr:response regulator [Anaerolineales bacterium]MCS7247566.1 response regulator [Anaerolineales bacterium]MDW8161377.1 response regulator [Anaerolineales bacterium]MDW8447970.1 response regulator [Anaerolineales bacterium]
MKSHRERILLVEDNAAISDRIARQSLRPLGYQVDIVLHASAALQEISRIQPDLIIANLNLPGLSGKDLLVAVQAQGYEIPFIVLAEETKEGDILQAFRLGAIDFLSWPAQETEIVATVERALKQVRIRQERQALVDQLSRLNQELEKKINDLNSLINASKSITVLTDPKKIIQTALENCVLLSNADRGLVVLRTDRGQNYVLRAALHFPAEFSLMLNRNWDDGVSYLVAESGVPLAIHGEPLKPFILSKYGQSALIVPLKIKNEVLGMFILLRTQAQPFDPHVQSLAEAITDYAAIALVNLQLIRTIERRFFQSQQEKQNQRLQSRLSSAYQRIRTAQITLDTFLAEEGEMLAARQKQSVLQVREQLIQAQEALSERRPTKPQTNSG